MELKKLSYYYNDLNGLLRDGDNFYIKKYTTEGFLKSRDMWAKYSHTSPRLFFDDFLKDYDEEFLKNNCLKCLYDISKVNKMISYDQLFDILIRRLVLDCFVGFKAEETISELLTKYGVMTHNENVIDNNTEYLLDTRYNVDVVTFSGNAIANLIQVKNKSTFGYNGKYICEKRKEFAEKNNKVNKFLGTNLSMVYYIYDKMSYINEGVFKFYVNRRTGKFGFTLDELINPDGKMKVTLDRPEEIK